MKKGLQIESVQFKNFMSVGEVLQDVSFENGVMTVLTGEDIDAPKLKRSGIGKAQPLYSRVLTPTGWKKIGDVGVGDSVTTPTGTTTMVNGVYPQGSMVTYTITLEDGRKTRACGEHLWKAKSNNQFGIINTHSIINMMKESDVYLPLSNGVNITPVHDLGASPYLLALSLMVGDINTAGYLVLKTFDEGVLYNLNHLYRHNDSVSFTETSDGIIVFDRFEQIQKDIERVLTDGDFHDLLCRKATHEQRMEFLKGICDVLGKDSNNNIEVIIPEYRKSLVNIIRELVWSIGGICHAKRKTLIDEYMHNDSEYQLTIATRNNNDLFTIIEKKVYAVQPDLCVKIKSIEKHEEEECVCISLISNDKLYITDSYIVTHNTTVTNALSFGIYGKPVSDIKPSRLTNKRNGKGMYVKVNFSRDGERYSIERGTKPDVYKFIKKKKELNETYGTKAATQQAIEEIVGMSHELFTMIVTINTVKRSYMKNTLANQRDIIEEILNISELTRKSKILSEYRIKDTKTEIEKEKVRLDSLKSMHKRLQDNLVSVQRQHDSWEHNKNHEINRLLTEAERLVGINVEDEIKNHQNNEQAKEVNQKISLLNDELRRDTQNLADKQRRLERISNDIYAFDAKKCPTCNQEIHDNSVENKRNELLTEATSYFDEIGKVEENINRLKSELDSMESMEMLSTHYRTIHEAYEHRSKMETLSNKIEEQKTMINPFLSAIEEAKKHIDETPISYDELNRLEKLLEHQLFLQKILTGRDSFVRRRIIDVSIPLLNERIEYYLRKTDITHNVKFESDLTLEISNNGEDYDFDNLSRGEQNWTIISLNLAMRDLFEQIHGSNNLIFVDELIDFGIDTAQAGDAFEILKGISHDSDKSIYLITHREELFEKADELLYAIKENSFTTYEKREN